MKPKSLPLIAILGPTASGKTALALRLAKKYGGEIICADSRTIYKGMDIGTAKPTREERKDISHHLLDLIEPGQTYTIYQFQKSAQKLITAIRKRGKFPILVGGSGLYLYTILFDYDFDHKTRRRTLIPNCLAIGIEVEKSVLRTRIKDRFQTMLDAGFAKEVQTLVAQYGENCLQLNRNLYGEMQKYLRGELTRDQLLERAEIIDWQLAKKQRTWFRQNRDQITWLPLDQAEAFINQKLDALQK
jgi:tRNA dimethylallyltransferase